MLRRHRRGGIPRDEDIHRQPHQISDEGGVALGVVLCPADLQGDGLALDVAQIAQPLAEPRPTAARVPRRETRLQHAKLWELPRWLCRSDERHDEQAQGEGDDEPDSAAPHGGVLQNARACSPWGHRGASPLGEPGEIGLLTMKETSDGVYQYGVGGSGVETAGLLQRQDPFDPPIAFATGRT